MYKNAYLLLCVLCYIVDVKGKEPGASRAIIGGDEALPGQFPYMVSIKLRKYGRHNCGGTIITSKWLLSASHCFRTVENSQRVHILSGTVTLSEGGATARVKQIIRYDTSQSFTTADICLLELWHPLEFSELIKPVALPHQDQEVAIGSTAYVIGWGHTKSSGGTISDDLQYAELCIFSKMECDQLFETQDNYTMKLCAGTEQGDSDSCLGDSGGPLISAGRQIGIVSYGPDICGTQQGRLAVYTRVAFFINWINSVILK